MSNWRLITLIITIFLFSNILLSYNVNACKDIIACGDATDGDFNFLLKVRDPSRSGLQVLCIVPEGYEYTYHHPWTGKSMSFKTDHKYIGVATYDDVIPNIVKVGMALSDSGISYGDADTGSRWVNPTKNAWDDFDWIRYACEKANNEDEAIDFLTIDAVKKMHATGVSENLFVVGPNKGFVVEADAFHFDVKEINDGVVVMSNYPKELWKTQRINTFLISRSFDTVVEKFVRNKGVVRLKSLYGIRIVEIGNDFISVKPISFFHALKTKNLGVITKINLGERKTVGYFSVELFDIDGNKAKVRVCNKFKAWEEKMLEHIQPRYGSITIEDMINWSRLHSEDLDSLRPMCQDEKVYEAVAIYKIPTNNFQMLSNGWFSPNHACSSIYVPFHICNTDIYDPYKTGEAAELSLNLVNEYGHGKLNNSFCKTEEVLIYETDIAEKIAINLMSDNQDVSDFLTIIDKGMQKQAFLTEEIWLEISKVSNQEIFEIIENLWHSNYSFSLDRMEKALLRLKPIKGLMKVKEKISEIALDICKSRIDAANVIGRETKNIEDDYNYGSKLIENGNYQLGFNTLNKVFTDCEMLIRGYTPQDVNINEEKNEETNFLLYFLLVLLLFTISMLILKLRINNLD